MRPLSRRAGIILGLATALVVPLGASTASAAAPAVHPAVSADCSAWTSSGKAYAYCDITSGHARVRADCVLAPDLYSPWVGTGTYLLWTGKCPWGIRGAILEYR